MLEAVARRREVARILRCSLGCLAKDVDVQWVKVCLGELKVVVLIDVMDWTSCRASKSRLSAEDFCRR